jgi:serine/threonine protein kinase
MVMEYLEGGDLFDYVIQRRKLSIEDIHRIFVQIIDAVEFCHQNGVYHLDLKTDNFVFADKDQTILKIIDFGLAKESNDNICKAQKYPFGTIGFYAPELFNVGQEVSCSKCDVFSIGIVLLMMIRPETIKNAEKGLNLYSKDSYYIYVNRLRTEYPSILSPELINLLLHMITIDPKDRYNIEEIKESDWYKGTKLSESEVEELGLYKDVPGPYVATQMQRGQKQNCIIS